MSNRQLSLTRKANEIVDEVPKRSRSKFVSDAIVYYSKKKGVMDDYLVSESSNRTKTSLENKTSVTSTQVVNTKHTADHDLAKTSMEDAPNAESKKIKIDKSSW